MIRKESIDPELTETDKLLALLPNYLEEDEDEDEVYLLSFPEKVKFIVG